MRLASATGRGALGSGFWRLWTSSGLSNLADGMFKVVLPLVALTVTTTPALIAGVTTALTLPWLMFALPVGAVIDRLDRRRAMLCANAARASVLAVLATTTAFGLESIWPIYVAAACAGLAEVFHDTAAQAILPQLVRREQLTRANSRLYAAELTANEFLGSPLGGLLVSAGAVLALAVPGGLWLCAAGVLLLVRGTFRVPRAGAATTLRQDVLSGLRFLWHNKVLRALAIMTGGFNFASSAAMAVFVLYAVGPASAVGLSEAGYGLLLTATAAGSLAGTFVADTARRRLGSSRTLAAGLLCSVPFFGVPAATAQPLAIATGFFVGGLGIVWWNVVAVSLRQRITPDAMLGSLTGGYRLLAWGSRPLGAAVGGVLAQWLGLRAVFGVLAALALTLLVLMRDVTEQAIHAADRDS